MTAESPRIAVYAGTFDPITNGHVDLARRVDLPDLIRCRLNS